MDFRDEHGDNMTADDFNEAWKSISADKLKVSILPSCFASRVTLLQGYQARVNAIKAEAKATMPKKAPNSKSTSAETTPSLQAPIL